MICITAFSTLMPDNAGAIDAQETQIKAAYMYQFTRFVRWPESAFNSPDANFELCVMGVDSFGVALSQLSQRTHGHHPIVLRFLHSREQARDCHVLYISTSEAHDEKAILAAVANAQVLTVSSLPGFVDRGGVIDFIRTDNHVRFNINRTACKRQGLTCSAKLLEVAVRVVGNGNEDTGR